MALRFDALLNNAATDIHASELHKFRGMAGISLALINNTFWSKPGDKLDHATMRKALEVFATTRANIPLPTWQAYAKGLDVVSDKIGTNMAGAEFEFQGETFDFDGIRDLDETTAVTAMVALFASYGVTSGGQVRDWAKQEGFAPFDADLVRKQRLAKAEAAKAKANEDILNKLLTRSGTDSSTLPSIEPNQDLAVLQTPDILAMVAHLGEADCNAVLVALNERLLALASVRIPEMPAPVEPPMLADDVVEAELPNKPRAARRAKLAA